MALTVDEVNSIADSLTSRGQAASAKLRDYSWVTSWTTQNQEAAQSAGAIDMIVNNQIPPWRQSGLDLAQNGLDDSDAENKWRGVGALFDQAIGQIDGYAADARLSKVITDTAIATAQQVPAVIGQGVDATLKAASKVIPWYLYAGLAAVGVLVVYIAIKTQPRVGVSV